MTGVPPRPRLTTSSSRTSSSSRSRDRAGSSSWRGPALIALVLALAAQLVVVYAPTAPGGPEVNGLDKLIHVAVFAAPTLAALVGGLPRRWVLALFLAHGPVSELVQARLLAHRDGSLLDAVADITGVASGAAVFVAGRRRQRW